MQRVEDAEASDAGGQKQERHWDYCAPEAVGDDQRSNHEFIFRET
jgi:hypothetical protein